MITAEAPGRVTELLFDGGELVKAGQVLVQQDVSSESSQFDRSKADLGLAQSNFNRVSRLYKNKVLSRAEYDAARSQLTAAEAALNGIQITIDKKQIVAPFDGDQQFSGRVNAIDTQIDDATRSVRIQATLDALDDESALLPGMYAKVEVVLPKKDPYLVVPSTAVSFATYGDSVFVIEEGENGGFTARQQFVQLGERRGDFVAVTKGLQANQRVVSEGVFKLRNGAAIVTNEEGKITPELNPQPNNS